MSEHTAEALTIAGSDRAARRIQADLKTFDAHGYRTSALTR